MIRSSVELYSFLVVVRFAIIPGGIAVCSFVSLFVRAEVAYSCSLALEFNGNILPSVAVIAQRLVRARQSI